jgi:hypothetical protein
MTTDQVKQVNQTLTSETDPKKIAAHAIALGARGHDNSAMALAAKANAVGEAKATGADDVDIYLKQIEAARATPLEHVPVPIDAPMTACEAQVLLNVLTSRQGHFDVEGVPVPLAITNVFDADTSHLIRVFQSEMHLPATGTMDAETAKALRVSALGPGPAQSVGWGPVASGSSGPVMTGFYGRNYGQGFSGWSEPWQHGYRSDSWAGWPWHRGWNGFVGQSDREFEHEHRRHERGQHHERQHFPTEEMPHHHHRPHLTEQQILQRQHQQMMREQQQYQEPLHPHHHHHHHHHPYAQQPPVDPMAAQEAAPPAGMPIGGGGGAAAMAAPLAVEPDHTADVAATDAAATATKGSWFPDQPGSYGYDPYGLYGYDPGFGYEPGSLGRDPGFGGYGSIGWGGPGGLGGYGSWGSFGGWGHGL